MYILYIHVAPHKIKPNGTNSGYNHWKQV